MANRKMLNLSSYGVLLLGFLIPFIASRFVGMALSAKPGVVLVSFILWAIGLVLAYLVYVGDRGFSSEVSVVIKLAEFVQSAIGILGGIGIVMGYLYYPTIQKSFFPSHLNFFLGVTLFVVGLRITGKDWKAISTNSKNVVVAVLLRWITYPLLAYCVSFIVFDQFLPQSTANILSIGMMLLSTAPSGMASNSFTLIYKGDLVLSVSLTAVNSVVAPFLQPLLIKLFLGHVTKVNTYGMLMDLIEVVLLPVIISSAIGTLLPTLRSKIAPFLGPMAVLCLAIIMMSSMSGGTAVLLKQLIVLPFLLVACIVHTLLAQFIGYYVPKFFGFTYEQRITSCYEVGLTNAAVAIVLGSSFFAPLSVLVPILYAKVQNIIAIVVFGPKFEKRNRQPLSQQDILAGNI